MQKIGLTNRISKGNGRDSTPSSLRRKGHTLLKPTDSQKNAIFTAMLKKMKIANWDIDDVSDTYDNYISDNYWPERPLDIIDTIVVGSNNSDNWDVGDQFDFDTSDNNDVTPGKPLNGISWHIFINENGMVKYSNLYKHILPHTPFGNTRSIGIGMQYLITNNDTPPAKRMLIVLERTLVLLCLQFKLNPYKAIKTQSEITTPLFKRLFYSFATGHKKTATISPGPLVPIQAIIEQVAIKMQTKLKYAGLYHGPIDGAFNEETKRALNLFHSESIELLYVRSKNQLNRERIR